MAGGLAGVAAERRRELLEAEGVGGALAEVRLVVPNRPGVVAELALALGRAGINIHDMSLSPSADNTRGEIAFWVPAEREAARARGGRRRVNVRFDPARRLRGDDRAARRQVDLPPRGDPRRDGRRAGARAQLPRGRRHDLDARTRCARSARSSSSAPDELVIRGVGLREARAPEEPIDVGNAGTLMRLLPGWLAAQDGRAYTLDGDASIRRRPVDRIREPLELMGARIEATDGRLPPFTVHGARLHSIAYELPVASAQVKSCTMLAALAADGATTITEPAPQPRPHRADAARRGRHRPAQRQARDGRQHRRADARGDRRPGRHELGRVRDRRRRARARLAPAGAQRQRQPHARRGSCGSSQRMGGDRRSASSRRTRATSCRRREPVEDLDVAPARWSGTTVEADEVPLAIDELPLVALLGCFAEGETVVRGAAGAALKETDRIATVVDGPPRPRRRDRGHRGRLRRDRHRRAAGRHDRLARRPPARDDGRDRGHGFAATASKFVGMDAAAVSYPRFMDDFAALA